MIRRAGLAVLVAAALASSLPATAAAGTAGVASGALDYSAAAGEANDVTVSMSGAVFTIRDAGAPVTPTGPACVAVSGDPNAANCSSPEIERISLSLGDLNDKATVGSVVLPRTTFGVVMGGGAGDDQLTGAPNEENSLTGDGGVTTGNDTLTGGRLEDSLNPGPGNDVVSGGDGPDSISSFGSQADGADSISGGRDTDRLEYGRNADTAVTLDGQPNDGANCPGPACEGDNIATDVDNVNTGPGDDTVIGSAIPNQFSTSSGADVVSAGGGRDTVFGGPGRDTLRGGSGGDLLEGNSEEDAIFGEGGDDQLVSTALDDDSDVFSGGAGTDSVSYAGANGPVRADIDGRPDDGVSGEGDNVRLDVETLLGSAFADVLAGSRRANELIGFEGDDRLVGKGGADALLGDEGDDKLLLGGGRDLAEGAAGADRITSRDKLPDEVLCGSATDRVKADRRDRIAADCDRVRRR